MNTVDPARELEPENGDFVAYLRKLEEGKINATGGLHVSLPEGAQDGMVVVQTTQEITESRNELLAQRQTAARNALAVLMTVLGPLVGLAALILIGFAVSFPDELEFLIPFAMVLLFVSVVISAEARKRRKAKERGMRQ